MSIRDINYYVHDVYAYKHFVNIHISGKCEKKIVDVCVKLLQYIKITFSYISLVNIVIKLTVHVFIQVNHEVMQYNNCK